VNEEALAHWGAVAPIPKKLSAVRNYSPLLNSQKINTAWTTLECTVMGEVFPSHITGIFRFISTHFKSLETNQKLVNQILQLLLLFLLLWFRGPSPIHT